MRRTLCASSLLRFHCSVGRWKVPTSMIYGEEDIMDYRAGLAAAKEMPVPVEVLNLLNVRRLQSITNSVAWWENDVVANCYTEMQLVMQAGLLCNVEACYRHPRPLTYHPLV